MRDKNQKYASAATIEKKSTTTRVPSTPFFTAASAFTRVGRFQSPIFEVDDILSERVLRHISEPKDKVQIFLLIFFIVIEGD